MFYIILYSHLVRVGCRQGKIVEEISWDMRMLLNVVSYLSDPFDEEQER